jgi:hypothetical protein
VNPQFHANHPNRLGFGPAPLGRLLSGTLISELITACLRSRFHDLWSSAVPKLAGISERLNSDEL